MLGDGRSVARVTVTGATLHRVVPYSDLSRCNAIAAGFNWCCRVTGAMTLLRSSMLAAMVGEESASFHATEEYASGSEYEWRSDLGNIHQGDGIRYKGRTFIQITGRNNYGKVSRWCYDRKMVPSPTYFVDNPTALGRIEFAWVGPACYWLSGHDHGYSSINKAADARDLIAATYMVNGGLNGLDVRRQYWNNALSLGSLMDPNSHAPAPTKKVMYDMASMVVPDEKECKRRGLKWPGWFFDVGDMHPRHIVTQAEIDVRRKQGVKTLVVSVAHAQGVGIGFQRAA